MIRYPRPAKPEDFDTRHAADIADLERAGAWGKALPEIWQGYKATLTEAQHNKCGYCEARLLNAPSHVEHHAPKAEVQWLHTPGAEQEHLTNLEPRSRVTPTLHPTGYWWLAYDWENWLISCERCNVAWKRCLYPVEEDPHPVPQRGTTVTPLLLHPFGENDPLAHLALTGSGQLVAQGGSRRGAATVATCGLHRESLRNERAEVRRQILELCEGVLSSDPDVSDRNSDELLCRCAADQPFAGTARLAVLERLGDEFCLLWADDPAVVALDKAAGGQ
ncbi:MAG: hypothetical protein RL071_4389 [Pseudomonadota bacterium]